MLTLYHSDLSAECYAVRLLAALLGVPLRMVHMDIHPGRDHAAESFLALNPAGSLPVLRMGDEVLCDWQAIMAHLAFRQGIGTSWWPQGEPEMVRWMGMARKLGESAGLARRHDGMGAAADIAACRARAHVLLRQLERHLWFGEREARRWLLAGRAPTAADIAAFVHVILCEEGGIDRMDYPAVRRWCDRLRHLPGFIVMSGVFAPRPDAVAGT